MCILGFPQSIHGFTTGTELLLFSSLWSLVWVDFLSYYWCICYHSFPIHQINCQIPPRFLISVRSSYTSDGLDCKAKRIQQARADGKRRKPRASVGGALVWWEMPTSHGLPCTLLGDGEGKRGASKSRFYHFWAMLGKSFHFWLVLWK